MKISKILLGSICLISIPFLFALTLPANDELFFADNGQIRSLDDNHRIMFRRSDNVMELREFGRIVFSAGAVNGTEMERMRIEPDGNVGINTTNTNGYKLAVNGNAIFTKATVKAFASWPDYVFNNNYSLRPLHEVEKYINQHHHLPEVPSAEEVEKNGLDLGDNQALLLKKIEELTLYVIDQDKKVTAIMKQNQELSEKINRLQQHQVEPIR